MAKKKAPKKNGEIYVDGVKIPKLIDPVIRLKKAMGIVIALQDWIDLNVHRNGLTYDDEIIATVEFNTFVLKISIGVMLVHVESIDGTEPSTMSVERCLRVYRECIEELREPFLGGEYGDGT